MKKVLVCALFFILFSFNSLAIGAWSDLEWSDITYIEGQYSRIYFDYKNGTFYCINDWIVNQDDGGVNGGLRPDEYNLFTFTLDNSNYEIRIYSDSRATIFRDGSPYTLQNFQSATSWTTSPNEPNIKHTIWEFSFEVPPNDPMRNFKLRDPHGGSKTYTLTPPPPSIVSSGPSAYPHYIDGEFSDGWTPPNLPFVPTRAYQDPVPDPAHPKHGFKITMTEDGGVIIEPEPYTDEPEKVPVANPITIILLIIGIIGVIGYNLNNSLA